MTFTDSVWYGTSALAVAARAALTPLSWLYAAGARIDAARSVRISNESPPPKVPVLSVGNLTVGGTGKTPVAAWVAEQLQRRSAAPAIIMRGYGGDEPLVHRHLNPGIPVVVDADRDRGIRRASAEGCDCAILDDGFQHRQVQRVQDWVLIAAEQWRAGLQVLPAGPLREPMAGLQRADVVIVTRKTASAEQAADVERALARWCDAARVARGAFALGELRSLAVPHTQPLAHLAGKRVLAIAALGANSAFFVQLRQAGLEIVEAGFPDHHAFSEMDAGQLARRSGGVDAVVGTLKDVVKLAPLWPPAASPLWYVSQHLAIESGQLLLDRGLEMVLAARHADSSTAGPAGPSDSPHGHRSSTAD